MNPTGSIKDRIALNIVDQAEKDQKLKKGMTIIAASSGNTACSVAFIASLRGYPCKVITSEKCSQEKIDAPKAYGAEVIVCPSDVPADSDQHYMNKAISMCKENPDFYDIDQYDNPLNPQAYYKSLGPELWIQTNHEINYFIASASTGGTFSGTSKYLKDISEGRIQCILADPIGSVFYQFWKNKELIKPGQYKVEGVGKDSIPKNLCCELIDQIIQVGDQDAFDMCHKLSQIEGLMLGGSAGLNVVAALQLASSLEGPATIVTVAPDTGVKYLSKIYNLQWLKNNGFKVNRNYF
ncbi:hypothetical protein IMG5_201450 [Ichthyophthirius multifiliis]|uniref:Tryptophan synthase beta chain-like PALP domain-containing protein n=1 Tax=Ichthyophthirius multifiliis TaxID=5932 RepID=G0R5Z6_ICHMU|nr:hypothetical protein IMG5_201450 [Ichthyophthirius multifiliis]EGR27120.1 hypothetical protein IMG5_201450 [Ichthyophthirius multifiliis]|eukprot:XP_004024004.1 hypothetical protein IMG5_201450 [Ichthyophthirius multifiliis]